MKLIYFVIVLLSLGMGYELRLYPPTTLYRFENYLMADLKANDEIINKEFKEYLKYGIVIHFTYFINFHRQQLFFDDLLETKKIQVSLTYDLWTKQYKMTRYFPKKSEIRFDTIEEVIAELIKLEKIKVIPFSHLQENEDYYFKTRVTAKISQFESYFHIIFSLLSIVKYKTTYLVSDSYSGLELLSLSTASSPLSPDVLEK